MAMCSEADLKEYIEGIAYSTAQHGDWNNFDNRLFLLVKKALPFEYVLLDFVSDTTGWKVSMTNRTAVRYQFSGIWPEEIQNSRSFLDGK